MPKYVVSKRIEEPTWNTTTVAFGDVAARLPEIKERTDGDIAMLRRAATTVAAVLKIGRSILYGALESHQSTAEADPSDPAGTP